METNTVDDVLEKTRNQLKEKEEKVKQLMEQLEETEERLGKKAKQIEEDAENIKSGAKADLDAQMEDFKQEKAEL